MKQRSSSRRVVSRRDQSRTPPCDVPSGSWRGATAAASHRSGRLIAKMSPKEKIGVTVHRFRRSGASSVSCKGHMRNVVQYTRRVVNSEFQTSLHFLIAFSDHWKSCCGFFDFFNPVGVNREVTDNQTSEMDIKTVNSMSIMGLVDVRTGIHQPLAARVPKWM